MLLRKGHTVDPICQFHIFKFTYLLKLVTLQSILAVLSQLFIDICRAAKNEFT